MALKQKKQSITKMIASSESHDNSYTDLQEVLGYKFKDIKVLINALTLASGGTRAKYERLEFLGDRVLGLVVAEMLYRAFPLENEGELALRHTALVKGKTAAFLAKTVGIDKFLKIPKSETNNMNVHPETFLADIFESVIGALYIDGGYDVAKNFVQKQCTPLMLDMKDPPIDAKTKLQEWLQAKGKTPPTYRVINVSGPDHSPHFTVEIDIAGYDKAIGEGSSKKQAETDAAMQFLVSVKAIKDKNQVKQGLNNEKRK